MKTKSWGSRWGTAVRTSFDGVLKQEIATQAHEPGRVINNVTQPGRNIILERNQKIRNDGGLKDLSFGRCVATVPIEDLIVLRRQNPDLDSKDGKIRAAAWARVLKDPANKKFLVVEKY